ncbi:hypothetical protein [Bradyrhizobium sp. 153]|uniref:hypothetical protein n=1 Tax=Bradyrhizobium sp. 153 TaxID=2782627 RepID=UPI001FFA21BA|nr:hypothetical protein [Bradyrhizobium sp. 153]MCK1668663.1 hypothetical protein [Bradyrhizobium sp. 153]
MHGTFATIIKAEPCRIWLDDRAGLFCTVSPEDYQWALQWRWHFVRDKHGRKFYARRNTRIAGRQIHVWLHKAILSERMGILPPSELHTIGDHGNGESLCNERWNLSWATPSMNRRTART